MNDLEQYSKMDNLVISAFNVQYKSCAQSVSTHDVDDYAQTNRDAETIESKVAAFFKVRTFEYIHPMYQYAIH